MLGLDAKMISFSRRTSSAAAGEDITRVSTWPIRRNITGPYLLARSRRTIGGCDLMKWRRLPIKGRFHGPGGRLFLEVGVDLRLSKVTRIGKERRKKKRSVAALSSMMGGVASLSNL